jgi:hypothetical protein
VIGHADVDFEDYVRLGCLPYKRYCAFDADNDHRATQECKKWFSALASSWKAVEERLTSKKTSSRTGITDLQFINIFGAKKLTTLDQVSACLKGMCA